MNDREHALLVDQLVPAVLQAGRVQMHHYVQGVDVERKGDASPVTAADRESEDILLCALSAAAPGVPVVAEEAVSAGQVPAIGDRFFLVDPLDGTREFIQRRGEFTINIALVMGARPVLGIVYAPALGKLYATGGTDRAIAADVAPDAAARTIAETAPRRIAARQGDPERLVALASRSHLDAETQAWLARHKIVATRQAGSSLKFCVVASGEADVYPRFGPTCEWDTAAGEAVLRAAGGRVTLPDGAPLVYGKVTDRFLNPSFIAWGRVDQSLIGG